MEQPTLGRLLSETAARWSARPALVAGELRLTWTQCAAQVERAAGVLSALGVRPGDRVGLMVPNSPPFVVALLAAARLGAIVVPLNPLLSPSEVGFILADSGARMLITIAPLRDLARAVWPGLPSLDRILLGEELLTASGAAPAEWPAVSPEDTAVLFYTSGTTGRPKGAMLTHRNLIFDAEACAAALPISEQDNFCCVLPFFHSFGSTVCIVLPLLLGACMTLAPRFAPRETLRLIAGERCTVMAGVPSMFALMAAVKEREVPDLSCLRLAVSGGAALPAGVSEACRARLGLDLLEGYGPTEASPVVTVNRLQGARKAGSVGPPLPGVQVRIVDEGVGEVAVGEVGEIAVRGANVMRGYYRRPEDTEAALREGWLLTGDLGRVDEDGHVYILDRKKDLIIVAGMNVYPREVEEVLQQHPAVAEAAVVGAACPLRGESPVGCVVLHEGQQASEAQLLRHCQQYLAPFKVPRCLVFYPELPRSATGKVLKRELRQRHADILARRPVSAEAVPSTSERNHG